MRKFTMDDGSEWIASAREETTPRHHGRWYLVFHPDSVGAATYPMGEVRWQSFQSAERTIATMSLFELRKRLDTALARTPREPPAG